MQICGIISKIIMDIQKKKWSSIYDKICVNWGFCAYMRMYREHGETEKTDRNISMHMRTDR